MSQPLVIRFRAETESARGAVVDLARATASAMGSVSAAAMAAHTQTGFSLSGIAMSAAKAAVGLTALQYTAIAAFAAFSSAAARGAEELERFQAIAEKAAASNVGTTFFQSFVEGAARFRISARDAEADLSRVERRTRDRFDAGAATGVANDGRRALGDLFLGTNDFGRSDAPRLYDQATSAEQRIRALQVAMVDLEATGNRLVAIDLARRMGLDTFAERVETGRASFRGLFDEAERLRATGLADGSIVSPELIARADELKRRFAENTAELTNNLRPILDQCAALAVAIGTGAAWSAEQFTRLVGVVGAVVQALRNATVEATALQGTAARLQAIARPAGAPGADDGPGQAQAARDAAARGFQRGTTRQAAIERGDNFRPDDPAVRAEFGADPARAATFDAPVPLLRPQAAPGPVAPPAPRAARAARAPAAEVDEWAKAYERLIEQMERANGTLTAEREAVGKGTVERERLIAVAKLEADARKAGGTVTDEQRARVIALAEAHGTLRVAIEQANAQQQAFSDAMQYAGDRIVDMAFNGRKLSDVLRGLAAELARAALTGQGMFAQLLGLAPAAGSPAGTLGGLFGLLGGLGGGAASGGITAGLGSASFWTQGFTFHGGGVIGAGGTPTLAPAGLFSGAPRYHRGGALGPTEVPVIAELGEEMLTRQQRQTVARAMRGADAPQGVTYNDFRGADPASEARIMQRLDAMDRNSTRRARADAAELARRGFRA